MPTNEARINRVLDGAGTVHLATVNDWHHTALTMCGVILLPNAFEIATFKHDCRACIARERKDRGLVLADAQKMTGAQI